MKYKILQTISVKLPYRTCPMTSYKISIASPKLKKRYFSFIASL